MSENTVVNLNAKRKKCESRTSWNGMTEAELALPNSELLIRLVQTANNRGQNLKDMADQLGVTYGYIAQLRSGVRYVRHISEEFVDACSLFLGVPKLTVKVWAGKINATDLVSPADDVDQRLDAALEYIASDPNLGAWMPASVRTMTQQEKTFIVLCYQQATGCELLQSRIGATREDYLNRIEGFKPVI